MSRPVCPTALSLSQHSLCGETSIEKRGNDAALWYLKILYLFISNRFTIYLLGFCLLIPNCEMFYWKSAFSVTVIASHLFVLCKWFLNHKLISWLGLGSMQCHEDQLVLDITQERPSTDGCHHYHYSVTLQSRLPGMLSQPHSHVVFVAFSQMLVCHTICKVTYIHPVWLSVTEFIPIIQRD